jgi:hypothetical protein
MKVSNDAERAIKDKITINGKENRGGKSKYISQWKLPVILKCKSPNQPQNN